MPSLKKPYERIQELNKEIEVLSRKKEITAWDITGWTIIGTIWWRATNTLLDILGILVELALKGLGLE